MWDNTSGPTRATLLVGGLFLGGLLAGSWAGSAAAARVSVPSSGLERFARVLTAIENHYVDPVDTERLVALLRIWLHR